MARVRGVDYVPRGEKGWTLEKRAPGFFASWEFVRHSAERSYLQGFYESARKALKKGHSVRWLGPDGKVIEETSR